MSATAETGAPTAEFLERIPRDYARHHRLLSAGRDGEVEVVLVSRDTKPSALFNVGVRLGSRVRAVLAENDDALLASIDLAYEARGNGPSALPTIAPDSAPSDLEALLREASRDSDLLSSDGKGPIVRLVDALLLEAIRRGASDLHLQPTPKTSLVRLRIDGALHDAHELDPRVASAAASRVKVMAKMDVAERRLAQDGRASVVVGERSIDLRIATFPTSHGERVVLRLLDPNLPLFDFEHLGMPAEVARRFLAVCRRPNGLVLVTGPTGAGKTTTLYATLREIATPDRNVLTIEDPIEYELSREGRSVSQSQVNTKKGITFATGLRHVLRQDPDVILVGEIRDAETARLAIQASLTGHLVLSTLHTIDAASAVTRLLDLGIEPFLLGSSLAAVLAQRLVRRRHSSCNGRGCEECLQSGYRGRCGIFEYLAVEESLRAKIVSGASLAEIRAAARALGMRTLREEGDALVSRGVTDALEVARVIEEER